MFILAKGSSNSGFSAICILSQCTDLEINDDLGKMVKKKITEKFGRQLQSGAHG